LRMETRKLLRQLAIAMAGQTVQVSVHPVYGQWTNFIPNDLRASLEDPDSLTLAGDRLSLYRACLKALAHDTKLEHLTADEIEHELWHFSCDVHLHQREHRYQGVRNARVDALVERVLRPLETYEVMLPVDHLRLSDGPLDIRGARLVQLDEQAARAWGISPDDLLFHSDRFADRAVAIVEVDAGSRDAAVRLARIEVDTVLHILRACSIGFRARIWDGQLLQQRGGYYAVRKRDVSGKWISGWDRGFQPIVLELEGALRQYLEARLARLQPVYQGGLGGKIGESLLRAVEWIGTSITRSEWDDKVVDLCTALECLLVTINDGYKAERVAVRAMLLSLAVRSSYTDPVGVYDHYLLRNEIVHGAARQVAGPTAYDNLRWVAIETLQDAMAFVQTHPSVTSVESFIRAIETRPSLERAAQLLETEDDGQSAKKVKKYIAECLGEAGGMRPKRLDEPAL
jgi:hypothetical protein